MKTFGDYLKQQVKDTQSRAFFDDFLEYKEEVNAEDVTIEFLEKLREYCLGRVSANSARVYLTYFKQAFYKAERQGYTFNIRYEDVVKYLYVRAEASEHVFLTAIEIKMLEQYQPVSEVETFVKNAFLLCCYVGCRISEYHTITEANIFENELRYTSQKTKISARLPLHPLVPELIANLNEFNYPPHIASPLVTQYIKSIYKKIGLNEPQTLFQRGERTTKPKWAFIAAHTPRRSFATNLYLDGYSIKQISSMLAHKSTNMTEGYILVSYSDDITGLKKYLNPSKQNDDAKLQAIKLQMMTNLGLSEIDADKMVQTLKNKIA